MSQLENLDVSSSTFLSFGPLLSISQISLLISGLVFIHPVDSFSIRIPKYHSWSLPSLLIPIDDMINSKLLSCCPPKLTETTLPQIPNNLHVTNWVCVFFTHLFDMWALFTTFSCVGVPDTVWVYYHSSEGERTQGMSQ